MARNVSAHLSVMFVTLASGICNACISASFHQWEFEALRCLSEQLAEFLFGFFSVEISFVFFAWKWERNNQPRSLVQSHTSDQAVSAFRER